jgi:rhomboid protease GluP
MPRPTDAREEGVNVPPSSEPAQTTWAERLKEVVLGPKELGEAKVTRALFALNVLVYLACVVHARSPRAFLQVPQDTMLLFGANLASLTVGDHRLESLLASCFLHFDILHLTFNMIALRSVGPFVERSVGPARYFPLVLGSGIVGAVASALVGWTATERLSAGASGAICGIIGAAAVLGYRTQGPRGPLTTSMARWLGATMVLGVVAHFDNWAHGGGAVAGALLAASWRRGYTYSRRAQALVIGACSALVLATAITVVYRDVTDRYLFMGIDDRLRVAEQALAMGRCDIAREAATRALRLSRRDRVSVEVATRILGRCEGK